MGRGISNGAIASAGKQPEEKTPLRSSYEIPPFPWGYTPEADYYRSKNVENRRQRMRTSRGTEIFTQIWTPTNREPKALICMVHGYGNNSSWTFQNTAILFTDMGYAACASDLEGHGQSEGLKGFLPDVDGVANDCLEYFHLVAEREEYQSIPKFLYGESLGGAICLLIHFMEPENWDGAILAAAMCKISDKMKPPWPVANLLSCAAHIFPTWAVVPTKDLVDKSISHPYKRELARNNPGRYAGKPRLGTVAELLRVTAFLGNRLQDVQLPVLIIHGDEDVVTEPATSVALFEKCRSKDKTLKIYQGMRHSLLQGETDENVAILIADISGWLEQRVESWNLSP
ncbi:hypothetical protein R1flu_014010 [Riccia fluitans]|uniref:Serine aminopeptidase S33 domain-containing protein n=1 Tax=Riccia fluitans TaxID=41844 RepID=A0ABD1YFZ4_9MARC